MSKQTTVRWLVSILNKDGFAPVLTDEEIQQALEIEREQIEDAYVECYMNHVGNGESILREANSYYKNTYGGQDESK